MWFWKTLRRYRLHHPLFWMFLWGGWLLLRSDDFPNEAVALQITGVKVAVLAALVYLTNYLLIPRLLHRKYYVAFGAAFIFAVAGFALLKVWIVTRLLSPYYRQELTVFSNLKDRVYDNLIPLFLLVSTAAAIRLLFDHIAAERRLLAISQAKAETELQYLKSQINPHFVFNTLNTIYFQIDKANQDARMSLLEFSDLLRYQLYECNADKIPVEKELTYLGNFINLQKKRKDQRFVVTFTCPDRVKGFSIVPLLLMPLVENAFKHVSHYHDRENSIHIQADNIRNVFTFSVSNTTESLPVSPSPAGGIGLKNVRRRLELLYPGRFSLVTQLADGVHSAALTLNIEKDDVYRY